MQLPEFLPNAQIFDINTLVMRLTDRNSQIFSVSCTFMTSLLVDNSEPNVLRYERVI
jgi:hypothetical protein